MFEINDKIHYGGSGVCVIRQIETMRFGRTREKYYVLQPLRQNAAVIYVPVNNPQLTAKMRPILSRQEVDALLISLPDVDTVWTDDAQERKQRFDALLRNNDCTDLVRIIKTLLQHKDRRQRMGKALHVADDNYLREAQRLLFDEMSVVLGIPAAEAGALVLSRLEPAKEA